jgi:hypothetical protein
MPFPQPSARLHPFAGPRSARNPRHPCVDLFPRRTPLGSAHGRRRRGGGHGVPAIAGAPRDAGDAEAEAAGAGVAGVEGHLRRPRGRGEAAAGAVQGGGGRARPPPPPRPRLPPVLAQRPRPRRRARGDSTLPVPVSFRFQVYAVASTCRAICLDSPQREECRVRFFLKKKLVLIGQIRYCILFCDFAFSWLVMML